MKILIIRNYPSYMSIKNNTYNIQEVGLAKALVRRGHKCDVLFWTSKKEEILEIPVSNSEDRTITVFYKNGISVLKNTFFKGCSELFAQYDILQPCEYNQVEALYLAKKHPQKVVIYHGPYFSPFNKKYNLMCKFFDFFFIKTYRRKNTEFIVKSELAKEFLNGKGLSNVLVAGVGIDSEMLFSKGKPCEEPLYVTMRNDSSEYKLLYIGRFEKRRNIPFILDIFRSVIEKVPNTMLYMIGSGGEKYIEDCWAYAEQLGIRDRIIWQPSMEQKFLSEVYKCSDIFILPTEYEIFGMVLLEAMYYENVVVTNVNGGSNTLIEDEENGIIIESKNPCEWADRIVKCIMNKNKMDEVKKNASKRIEESFTWDALAPLFEKYYKERLGLK